MVRSRIGLPSKSTPPEGEALALLDACLDACVAATLGALRGVNPVTLGCILALGGCGPARLVDVEGVVRDGRTGAPIASALVSTQSGATTQTGEDGRFSIPMEEGSARRLTARAPGRCPSHEEVDVSRAGTPEVVLHLFDRVEVDSDLTQVGFDADVRVDLRLRCEPDGPIAWAQIAGPTLASDGLRAEDGGRTLVIHTRPLEESVQLDDRVGVIPFTRGERGEYRVRMRATFDGEVEEAVVRIVAAPTSAGIFQVPTGSDVYLNGGSGDRHDWTLVSRPEGSEAALDDRTIRTPHFRPDRFGTYIVRHGATGTQMSLQAGPYEDVPRDCGREGCHRRESEGWAATAHARTFRRGIEGELGEDFSPRCWSCHATGVDFGIDNGGLHHTAARLGWRSPPPSPDGWEATPRLVRRHGSVWCSACHGPGRIVPPPYRWQYGSKFRVGVCARCHDVDEDDPDADHRSPEVDEWRTSPMSRFARGLSSEEAALRAGCTRCHSAQGFVSWIREGRARLPARETVAPITCAACHDAHDATHPRLLRVDDAVEEIAGGPARDLGSGALCASCHRPPGAEPGAAPHAPQASLLLGRGARTTPPLEAGAHRYIANTCVRCHMTRPSPGDAGYGSVGGHTFSVRARRGEPALSRAACAPCHGEGPPEAIGARDWDGDGREGPIAEEREAALRAVTERLAARIVEADVRDGCEEARRAAGVVDLDARLHLVDAEGRLLGDCDSSGAIEGDERALTTADLPRETADAAWDVALLRADGSGGVHNPRYTFAILEGLRAALQ